MNEGSSKGKACRCRGGHWCSQFLHGQHRWRPNGSLFCGGAPSRALPALLPHRRDSWMVHPCAGSVRFADERAPSPRPTPAAALPPRLEVRLGFVLQGGIYITDLLCLEGTAAEAQPAAPAAQPAAAAAAAPPQPEVRGLDAANLSISVECGATGQPPRVALRLWADREGPFDATFSLVLPPEGQEVRGLGASLVALPAVVPPTSVTATHAWQTEWCAWSGTGRSSLT